MRIVRAIILAFLGLWVAVTLPVIAYSIAFPDPYLLLHGSRGAVIKKAQSCGADKIDWEHDGFGDVAVLGPTNSVWAKRCIELQDGLIWAAEFPATLYVMFTQGI